MDHIKNLKKFKKVLKVFQLLVLVYIAILTLVIYISFYNRDYLWGTFFICFFGYFCSTFFTRRKLLNDIDEKINYMENTNEDTTNSTK